MFELSLVALGLLSLLGAPSEPEQDHLWEFLREVSQDDVFSYHVCDARFVDTVTGESGRCYDITIHIKDILYIKNNTYYYVHATTHDDSTGIRDRLFVIDSNQYDIKTIFAEDRDYAVSLHNTVFWRDGWGGTVDTRYGAKTDVNLDVNDDDTALIVSDSFMAQNGAIQHAASYDHFQQSFFEINDGIPLPVRASISSESARHTENTLFTFELYNYTTSNVLPSDVLPDDAITGYPEIINNHVKVRWQ